MKTLLILRHAKSSWGDSSLEDRERPLNERGRRDAPRMGDLLCAEQLVPDIILTSDAVRAHTTAMAAAKAAGYTGEIVVDPGLYLASPEDILSALQAVADTKARTVMIVGHNPGLEELLARLSGESHDLPTAALVHLELPIETWSELDASTPATLVEIWRPSDLPH